MNSPVYTGILIQILIQIDCVYTEANWIQIQTQTTSPMDVDCDPDSNPDLGPGACVNAPNHNDRQITDYRVSI